MSLFKEVKDVAIIGDEWTSHDSNVYLIVILCTVLIN